MGLNIASGEAFVTSREGFHGMYKGLWLPPMRASPMERTSLPPKRASREEMTSTASEEGFACGKDLHFL